MNLTGYISAPQNSVVNCYDQAAAVCAFGTLLGMDVKYNRMEPFGYIKTNNLVGVGDCNNPFFGNNVANKTVAPNWPQRTGFGNHAFAIFNNNVFAACVGPVLGKSTSDYITDTIDTSRPGYGNSSHISPHTITIH